MMVGPSPAVPWHVDGSVRLDKSRPTMSSESYTEAISSGRAGGWKTLPLGVDGGGCGDCSCNATSILNELLNLV